MWPVLGPSRWLPGQRLPLQLGPTPRILLWGIALGQGRDLGWDVIGGFSKYVVCEHYLCGYMAISGNVPITHGPSCRGPGVKVLGQRDRLVAGVTLGTCRGTRTDTRNARTCFQTLLVGDLFSFTLAPNRSPCLSGLFCLDGIPHG